jgi:hypothetical protein
LALLALNPIASLISKKRRLCREPHFDVCVFTRGNFADRVISFECEPYGKPEREIDSRGVVKIVISLKKGRRGRLILEVLFH